MSLAVSRAVLRRSQFAVRRAAIRNASTNSEVAGSAKEKASQAASKASEGLSRVTSSAGSAIIKAGQFTSSALGGIGGRTGRLIGFVQSMIPPTIYYSKVGLELGKIVFEQRKMSPPSLATFQVYFQPVLNALRHPATLFTQATTTSSTLQPTQILNRVRNLNNAQLASAAVVTAEIIGFFSVGEMLGRFKIIGYRSSEPAHH
jgi:F-type H+-transporting ATPase subunit g